MIPRRRNRPQKTVPRGVSLRAVMRLEKGPLTPTQSLFVCFSPDLCFLSVSLCSLYLVLCLQQCESHKYGGPEVLNRTLMIKLINETKVKVDIYICSRKWDFEKHLK